MRVIVGCEFSGVVRDAFLRRGHEAWSCDLRPTTSPGPHILGDVLEAARSQEWDLAILHPPCTYLCSSGLHWNTRRPERAALTEAALVFVQQLLALPIPRIALENPVGCISTRIRKQDQIIQPYEYGHDASKKTALWLKNLPLLTADPANRVAPRIVTYNGKVYERYGNQTDSGQNKLPPSELRSDARSQTYLGVAEAFAEQWGNL